MKKISIYILILLTIVGIGCSKDTGYTDVASNTGQGGSLARFTIGQDHLYVVDHQKLYAYSLANPDKPLLKSTQNIGIDIETIYTYKDKLFIGSRDAMYIYSISDAARPSKLGSASHVRACDPVVANDSIAYVTVRSGSSCGGTVNEMYVYNVSDVLNPRLRNTITLNSPYGLGMHNDRLYVCDGKNGLRTYDITHPTSPKFINVKTGETFYDVIAYNDMLICMVDGGMILYDYGTNDELQFLAKISG